MPPPASASAGEGPGATARPDFPKIGNPAIRRTGDNYAGTLCMSKAREAVCVENVKLVFNLCVTLGQVYLLCRGAWIAFDSIAAGIVMWVLASMLGKCKV